MGLRATMQQSSRYVNRCSLGSAERTMYAFPMSRRGLMIIAVGLAALFPAIVLFLGYFFFDARKTDLSCRPEDSHFASPQMLEQVNISSLAWGDFDADGDDDIAAASFDPANAANSLAPMHIFRNEGGAFVDVTSEVLPREIYATAAYFVDYDNDRNLDLFVLEPTVSKSRTLGEAHLHVAVFRGHDGTFTETTRHVRLGGVDLYGNRGSFAFSDLDSDGLLDFIVFSRGIVTLVKNFEPQSDLLRPRRFLGTVGRERIACGAATSRVLESEPELATKAATDFGSAVSFVDHAGCIYAENAAGFNPIAPLWELSKIQNVFLVAPGEMRVFRNSGVRFEEQKKLFPPYLDYPEGLLESAPTIPWDLVSYKLRHVIAEDFDADKLPDLLVVSEGGKVLALRNKGNFEFDERRGYITAIFGAARGVARGDLDRQGAIDLILTSRGNALLFRRGEEKKLLFDDRTSINRQGLGNGLVFTDIDNDGWIDLLIANGRESTTAQADESSYYGLLQSTVSERAVAYMNNRGVLRADPSELCQLSRNMYTVSSADFDGNGYVDAAFGSLVQRSDIGRGIFLLRNKGGSSHFVGVRLEGGRSNSYGVGAIITVVRSDGTRQSQVVEVVSGFYSQNSYTKIFGLSSYGGPVTVLIEWPSGVVQEVGDLTTDTVHTIREI